MALVGLGGSEVCLEGSHHHQGSVLARPGPRGDPLWSYLVGDQFDVPWSQSHRSVRHDLCFDGAQASSRAGLNKAVQHHVQKVSDLRTTGHFFTQSGPSHIWTFFFFGLWGGLVLLALPDPGCPRSWPGWRDTSVFRWWSWWWAYPGWQWPAGALRRHCAYRSEPGLAAKASCTPDRDASTRYLQHNHHLVTNRLLLHYLPTVSNQLNTYSILVSKVH